MVWAPIMLIAGELQIELDQKQFRDLTSTANMAPADLDDVPERPIIHVWDEGWSVHVCLNRDSVEFDLFLAYLRGQETMLEGSER